MPWKRKNLINPYVFGMFLFLRINFERRKGEKGENGETKKPYKTLGFCVFSGKRRKKL